MIDERDWAAMMVPHDLRERVSHITVAALREFGVEVENIARQAVGAPRFESVDEYLTYRSWAFSNPEKVA